ncbi:MAG: hypothetical protein ACHQ2Z_15130 [Elusimicrobiota bacterium]
MKTVPEVCLDLQLLVAEVQRRLAGRRLTPHERLAILSAVRRRASAHVYFWSWMWFAEENGARLAPLFAYQLYAEIESSAAALAALL